MAKKILFLQLSPEFGSTKFGPFTGAEIRLGNDPGRNDIVLPENLGVSAEHCRVVKQQDETFIVAPVDRTSQVFVWRKDGRPPKQINAPQALTDGDGFSLGSAEGPRFIITLEHPKAAKEEAAGPKGGLGKAASRLSGKGFMNEVKRFGFAKALTSSVGHSAANAYTFIRTGAFLQPRYILLGLMIAMGWIFAGTMSCGVAGLAVQNNNTKAELQDVKDQCGLDDPDDEGPPTINKQTKKLLGPAGAGFKEILDKDAELAAAYKKKLAAIKGNAALYDWVRGKGSNQLSEWQGTLSKSSAYDDALIRVFTYLAATPNDPRDFQGYRIFQNPEKEFSCYRGPLQMSWRQADRFGMSGIFLDAPIDMVIAQQGARDIIQPLIEAEPAKVGAVLTLGEGDEITIDPVTQQENLQCAFIKGEDDRDKTGELPASLKQWLGKNAKGVPGAESKGNFLLNRMFRWYAADWQRGFKDAKFDDPKKTLTAQLEANSSATDDAKKKVIDDVATLMARAAIIPCLGIIGNDEAPEWMLKDAGVKNDSKVDCAIFLFLIDEEAAK